MRQFKFGHKKRRRVPALNTVATADISFMLLVFFLITTSMDSDKGLFRKMPALDTEQEQGTAEVLREDVMVLHIHADGTLTADNDTVLKDSLRSRIITFAEGRGDRAKNAVIKLESDSMAQYETYFAVQEDIIHAYAKLRGDLAMKRYKKPYNSLPDYKQAEIKKYYPQRISEN